MKRFALAMVFVVALAGVASAEMVQRTYYFTGADLVNNVFDTTARYSDGSLDVYEGMRQIGPAEGRAVGATFLTGGYLTAFNTEWDEAVNGGYVLNALWLDGFAGYSGQWGEDYKAYQWISGTGPAGWTFSTQTDSAPPVGYHTDQYPVWTTDTAGLDLTSTALASEVFSVTIEFDTTDMWWNNPNNYLYGCNTAPNSLDGLTMYFGSYLHDGTDYVHRYVGNMLAEVPEPSTFVLLVGGLGALLAFNRRRRTR